MLTLAQLSVLNADILADPTLSAHPNNDDGNFAIAAVYNTVLVPAFRVWRTNVPTKDVKNGVVWTEYIGRSVGERSAFELMISNGIINGADANIRQGILDIFSGPGGAGSRANLTALSKRDSTRAEKLFAAGTGPEQSPATMFFEGNITHQEVGNARNLP
jgi:hypothetical protein